MRTNRFIVAAGLLLVSIAGCESQKGRSSATAPVAAKPVAATSGPAMPPDVDLTKAKEESLSDIVQLTKGFDRAGEAYFSRDMTWIIFQASPKGEPNYQMYVAPLKKEGDRIVGAGDPVRISPPKSRNTCGYFSPDGKSLIFGSTAGKEDPAEPSAGYQRQGGAYRWDFPNGMEIFRSDEWQERIAEAQQVMKEPGQGQNTKGPPLIHIRDGIVEINLAHYAITKNDAYDAEGSFSADGKFIIFCSRRDGDGEIYTMHPDGSHPVRLTHAKGYDGGPFFVPDGKRIVYRSDRKGNDLLQVFVADLAIDGDGEITGIKNEKQLTDADVNWGPYFFTDNHHIIYATSVHGHHNYELYAMRDDGSHKTRITYKAGFDGLPVFSPDGKYLMWSSKRSPDNTTQIFIAKFLPPSGW